MSVKENVKTIIDLVGGIDNVQSFSHCFTRLRFILVDRKKVNDEELAKADGVMGIIDAGGQLQVVIGNAVSSYYEEAAKIYPAKAGGEVEVSSETDKNASLLDKITDIASAIFVPIVGVLAASGTLQGFLSLFVMLKWLDPTSGSYLVLYAISNAIFYYFPIFLAYTSAKKFGGKPFYAMIIACAMITPEIINAVNEGQQLTLFALPLTLVNYSKTVFPIILSTYLAAIVEKFARKIVPDILKMIFVPMIVLCVVTPLAFLIIGPVLTAVMSFITDAIQALYAFSPLITGVLVGGIWQLLVLFGVSKAFSSIFIANLAAMGYCPLIAIVFFASAMGQTGAVLGFGLRSKNKAVTQVCVGSAVSGLFGITEPALFGINVPARKPFIFGLAGGALGGLIASLLGGKGYTFGTGILGIPALINPAGIDMGFYGALLGAVASLVLAFGLTYMFGWSESVEKKLKV
ncbi:PTS system beta-glucosides-specific IIC component [Breznakia blatticola]|uniref:PTS system beta-glucosides-specific IIC component n=1 Tax=Breznakia blatticola TaxID=1754012 RepID=A0A4R7ZLV3_9FIRM|nr:PTS transporter subunit EIIC [Breznakia blatticola]TDW16190.1 PTS system beta-glucosides-specific IIC component [Breznakia blatticola]